MAIAPARLPAITSDDFPPLEIETRRLKVRLRPHRPPKEIGFSSACGAWAGAPKFLQRQIRFLAIRPGDGELGSNLLNHFRLEHINDRLRDYGVRPEELEGLYENPILRSRHMITQHRIMIWVFVAYCNRLHVTSIYFSNAVLVRQIMSFQEQLAVMIVGSGIRKKNGAC
jgi:hypothetical protein